MKPCTTCASPLYGDVKYCPFCGKGTTADARTKKTAPAQAAVDEPVVPAPAQRMLEPVAAPAPPPASPAAAVAAETPSPKAPPGPKSKAPKAAPAQTAQAPASVDTAPVAPKKGSNGKWIVIGVILASLYFYVKGKPDQNELSCNAAFDAGNKALLAKDIAGARSQAMVANGVCTGASRSKLQSLQAAIDAADSVATGCVHSFSEIDGYLDDHKLTSARTALNQLSSTCAANPEAAEDRKKLSAAVAATQAAQSTLRNALDAKNLAGAKAAYGQLAGLNRENDDLASLKNELDQLTAEAAAAAEAPPVVEAPTTVAEPALVQPAVPAPVRALETSRATLPPPSRKPDTDNGANVKAEMAASFLHDAETAMSQKKFDAAKTYVDSARRMDPNNPRIDSMSRQIREREHQVLQQETTLQ